MFTLREKGWAKWILTLPLDFLQTEDHSQSNTEPNPTCDSIAHEVC